MFSLMNIVVIIFVNIKKLAITRMSILNATGANDDGGGGDNSSFIRRAALQSKHHHQNNTQLNNAADAFHVAQPTASKR